MKAIKSPIKFLLVLATIRNRKTYLIFKELSTTHNKHFYGWQWNILDGMYKAR